jgi:hypothetical protein
MPKRNEHRFEQLAVAIASGSSVAAWCRKSGVPERTAYHWYADPEFQEKVAEHRNRIVDRAIGKLTAHVTKAVGQIAALAKGADSESVRLQASRAILAELISVSNWSDLDRRLKALEERNQEEVASANSQQA